MNALKIAPIPLKGENYFDSGKKMSVLVQGGVNLLGAGVAGALYCAGESMIGHDPSIGMNKETAIRFASSAGCHAAADVATTYVIPSIMSMSPLLASYEKLLVQPVLSGGAYLLLDSFLHADISQTKTYKFLLQVGASAASNYGTGPLRCAIGM